jgi:hypothetical protein
MIGNIGVGLVNNVGSCDIGARGTLSEGGPFALPTGKRGGHGNARPAGGGFRPRPGREDDEIGGYLG